MDRDKLSPFFDQACAVSLYILFFCIPFSCALVESFFGFALLFFIGRLLTTRGLFTQCLKNEELLLVFFIALELSLINSGPFILISLRALFLKWAKYIILYFVVKQTLTTTGRIKYTLAGFCVGAGLIILDSFSRDSLIWNFSGIGK